MNMIKTFDDITLRNLSDAIAGILTHSKITEYFANSNIQERGGSNKTDRVYYAFRFVQQQDRCGNNVLAFVQKLLTPKRYKDEKNFENDRSTINEILSYEGVAINERGDIISITKAKTISEAKERSSRLKRKAQGITIHSDILPFCDEEWLKEDYFHAILEITKSVADKMRQKSGLFLDGSELVDACFGLGKEKRPLMAFNTLRTLSEESEHKGFSNFIKGFFSMYRNPKAHTPRMTEDTQLSAMIEVLVVASIIHNKLDKIYRTGY